MFGKMTLGYLLVGTAALAGAQELPAALKAKGSITIGVVPNYPPLESRDPATNKLVGFDIDLGTALAQKLGLEAKWEETSFEQLLSGVKTGRLDAVISGMSDLASRHDSASYVDYIRTGSQLFIQASRQAEFPNREALCGKTVGASRRTSYPAQIKDWSDANCVAKGRAAILFRGTEGSADARTQLRQGRIDAALQGNETLPYIMSMEPGTYAIVGEPIQWTLMGVAVGKDEAVLQKAILGALNAMQADGSYKKLLDKWKLSSNPVTQFTINGGQ